MSERELREKNIATGNDADSQLNFQQLTKSLLTLLNLYGAVDAEGGSGWLHEAEFYSYYVLLNLGDRDHFKVSQSLDAYIFRPSNVKHGMVHSEFLKAISLQICLTW